MGRNGWEVMEGIGGRLLVERCVMGMVEEESVGGDGVVGLGVVG